MKIISVGIYNPIPLKSGVDSYIYYLLNSIGRKNEVLHYYFYESEEKVGYRPHEINFETEYVESRVLHKLQMNKLPKPFLLTRPELLVDKYFLKPIRTELVICDIFTYHVGRYISKKNGSPLLLVLQNIEWKYFQSYGSRLYPLLKAYEHYVRSRADAIVTISREDYRYVANYIDENKIYYIPPGLNTTIFKPDGSRYEFGDDKFNLLFYGSLDRPMNIEALKFIKHDLIPALKKENLLEKIRINIFGSGTPPQYLSLEDDEDINYLGAVEDPGEYIKGADVVIVPLKHSGGMKIRLLETLFCGKPVVATPEAAEGLPEDFKKFVYIEKDVEGFINTIRKGIEEGLNKEVEKQIIEDYLKSAKTLNDVISDFQLK